MSIELAAILIVACLIIAILIGIPVAFCLIGVGLIFAVIFQGPGAHYRIITAVWAQITSEVMLAIPLFVLMAMILEFSGIGDGLFDGAHKWLGGLKGSLAVATVAVSTLLAAITGTSATAIVIMGRIARPQMYKHGYAKSLVLGCIPAAGTLGPIIPPSIYMIVLAMMSEQSVGKVFMGGVFSGLLISVLFSVYIIIRSNLQPGYAPAVSREDRASWREKFSSLKDIGAPLILILAVLGTIYAGIATPTEAAAIGTVGAILIAAIYRRLTGSKLNQAIRSSLLLTVMIMWIAIGGTLYAGVLRTTGVANLINDMILGMSLSSNGILILMIVIALLLGMFMDGLAIIMITFPIFVPIVSGLHVDLVYFCVIYTISIVIGLITPPFAVGFFYLKGVAPEEKMEDMYRASLPFIAVMVIALLLCVAFPDIVMWLPNRMI